MGYIRLRRRQFWSAGASEARPRFGSLGPEFRHSQSAVAAALCRRTPKVPRVAYPADSSVSTCLENIVVQASPCLWGVWPLYFRGRDARSSQAGGPRYYFSDTL